jgi:hypothetical protein
MDVLKGTAETLPQADATEAKPKGGSSDGTPPKTFVQPKMNKTKRSKAQKQPQFEEASVEKNSESTRKASAESSASMSASASSIALSADAVNANLPELHQVYRVHNWNTKAPAFEPTAAPGYAYTEHAAPAWNGWWTANSWQEQWEPSEPSDMWEQVWTTVKMADGKVFMAAREPLKENSVNRVAAEGGDPAPATLVEEENDPPVAAPGL